MKYLVIMGLVIISFSAGVIMGWDSGVRDAKNLETVQTP